MEKVERAQVKQWNISRKEPLKRYSYYAEAARTAAADDDDDDVFQSAATTITGFTFLHGKNCSKAKQLFSLFALWIHRRSVLSVLSIFSTCYQLKYCVSTVVKFFFLPTCCVFSICNLQGRENRPRAYCSVQVLEAISVFSDPSLFQ